MSPCTSWELAHMSKGSRVFDVILLDQRTHVLLIQKVLESPCSSVMSKGLVGMLSELKGIYTHQIVINSDRGLLLRLRS
jgi:hypothetical protein